MYVRIKSPINKIFLFLPLAVVDPKKNFSCGHRAVSATMAFWTDLFFIKRIYLKKKQIFSHKFLLGSDIMALHILLGDEGFALRKHLM